MVFPFVGFNGLPRSGKTLAVTDTALRWAGRSGLILGNYLIKVPNFKMITPYDLVCMLDGDVQAKERYGVSGNVVLALQEVYGWLNSHKSLSGVNDLESAFVFQASKLDYNIVWDSQIAMRVDSSLRDMTPFRFDCEKKKGRFVYHLLDRHVKGRDVRVGRRFSISVEKARTFWDLYDTHKGLKPLGYGEMVLAMEKTEPKLMDATVERQTELLWRVRGEYGLGVERGCVKIAVEDALMRLGESPYFAGFVANRLRLRLRKKEA